MFCSLYRLLIFAAVLLISASCNMVYCQDGVPAEDIAKREYLSVSKEKESVFLSKDGPILLPADQIFDDAKILDFIWAIQNNDLKLMKELYESGINLNYRGKFGFTPLFFALRSNEECFRWLLKKGANPDVLYKNSENYSESLLELALSESGWFNVSYPGFQYNLMYFRLLLEYGADPDIRSMIEFPGQWNFAPTQKIRLMERCLGATSVSYDLEPIKLLIKYGAKINPPDFDYLKEAKSYEAVLLLLQNGADETRKYIVKEPTRNIPQGEIVFQDSYIDVFSKCHGAMEGASFDEYKTWAEEVYRTEGSRSFIVIIHEWVYYWKVTEFLRAKGYPLKSLEECEKMDKRITTKKEDYLNIYYPGRPFWNFVPEKIIQWRQRSLLKDK